MLNFQPAFKKTLRPYQTAAEISLFKYLYNKKGNPLVVAPVGAGKSLMIASFIKTISEHYPGIRILKLTHVKELLEQNGKELVEFFPEVDLGFYCAGLNQKQLHNDVTFASIQSVYKKLGNFPRAPEIIIIDEAHLISHDASTIYRTFIDAALKLNPNCRVIGYTGTDFRTDSGRIDEGDTALFDDVCYEIPMTYMIDEGYWARPVCPEIAYKMDTSNVLSSKGDFTALSLQRAVNKAEITEPCVAELIEKAAGRKRWLIFTAGVRHCEEVTAALIAAGVDARCVHSDMPPREVARNLREHKAGNFKALVNVAKLTTGYNDPYIDCLVFMRPTKSPVLYIQITGRGVRPVYADGFDLGTKQGRLDAIAASVKPDCMLIDFGGVVDRLGPVDKVTVEKSFKEPEEAGGGEIPMKVCPTCTWEWPISQQYCLECGYCFIELEKASRKAVMSADTQPEWVKVMSMHQGKHVTADTVYPSMKVTYTTMAGSIREWVCFEHWNAERGNPKRYAWDKACEWHNARLPSDPVPNDVLKAIKIDYPQPSEIFIRKKGQYFEVLDYKWGQIPLPEDKFAPVKDGHDSYYDDEIPF